MELKSCPKYKQCNCNDTFVIRCNRCDYYKGYKAGYEKARKKYEQKACG